MRFRQLFARFLVTFLATLVAAAVVTLLWNIIFHDVTTPDWDTAFFLAFLFGVVFFILEAKDLTRPSASHDE
ncbi:MAG: hypothetical protein GY796_08095 [Chloroflexi bacterium]|nr:hypothetical protein [Chloroflexota bacterium]